MSSTFHQDNNFGLIPKDTRLEGDEQDEHDKRKQLRKERRRAFTKKLIQEGRDKDTMSYSKDVVTVEEQARREPVDFIGHYWAYNLNSQCVKRFLAGTYSLVFACPRPTRPNKLVPDSVEFHQQPKSVSQVFPPNVRYDTLMLFTKPINPNFHPKAYKINKYLENGDWGVILLQIAGRVAIVRFVHEDTAQPCRLGIKIQHQDVRYEERTTCGMLEDLLDWHEDDGLSTVEFGYKQMSVFEDAGFGFHFIRLNLSVHDPRRGIEYVHTIVAVKGPGKDTPTRGNWPSGFFLNQPWCVPKQVEDRMFEKRGPRPAKKHVEHDPDKTPTKPGRRKKGMVVDLTDNDGGVGLGIFG